MRCHRKHTLGVGDSCRVYTPWLVKIGINPYYCSLGISHSDTLCWGHLMSPDHIVNDLDHHLPWTFQERRFWIIVLFDDTHCPPRVCYASTRAVSDFTLVVTSICCCFHFSFGLGCPQYAPPKISQKHFVTVGRSDISMSNNFSLCFFSQSTLSGAKHFIPG